MTAQPRTRPLVARRTVIVGGATAVLWIASGCADDDTSSRSGAETSEPAQPSEGPTTTAIDGEAALGHADFDALATCVLLPEMTPGPFPTLEQLVRRDVTEGYPGRPLRLGLRVVDGDCVPAPGAAVEVWHSDASGDYSSYIDSGTGKDESEGTTFLRGTQTGDEAGIVEFRTI